MRIIARPQRVTRRTPYRARGRGSRARSLYIPIARTPREFCRRMSSTISSTTSRHNVTFKPWFLTYNNVDGDLFAWKDGARLKLKDGQSAGRVRAVSVISAEDKTVTVSLYYVYSSAMHAYSVDYTCSFKAQEWMEASSTN